jgi:hypothetical protein
MNSHVLKSTALSRDPVPKGARILQLTLDFQFAGSDSPHGVEMRPDYVRRFGVWCSVGAFS